MKLNHWGVAWVALAIAIASVVGCGGGEPASSGANTITTKLSFYEWQNQVDRENFPVVKYSLTNVTTGFHASGSTSSTERGEIEAIITGVPVGGGYSLSLTATSRDGSWSCTGATTRSFREACSDNDADDRLRVRLVCQNKWVRSWHRTPVIAQMNVECAKDAGDDASEQDASADASKQDAGADASKQDACVPLAACPGGDTCGTVPDGCGGTLSCGVCTVGQICNIAVGGTAGTCSSSCIPTSCSLQSVSCGVVSDECGGVLQCGTCGPGSTCGGGGIPGQCGSPCAQFNAGAGCTPTEQRFANKSPDCYACLINGACLDDATFGDTGNECEDLSGNATGGDQAGTSNEQLCLSKVDCVLATGCAATDVSSCYCGSLAGSACATSPVPGNGACAKAEANGASHFATDPASVVAPALENKMTGAGLADSIFACSIANGCGALCNQPVGPCTPATACPRGETCGLVADGCGGTLNCGTCASGQRCTAAGQCCKPATACPSGQGCGTAPDGCGGTIACGTCASGQICINGAQCCKPATACPAGQTCGTAPDGCGGTIACGTCTSGQTCTAGRQCCTRATACPSGQTCGTAPDGCGGTIVCGECPQGQACSAGGQCVACTGQCASPCSAFNNGAGCTPTEQKFVNKSVACYTCLVNGDCLDNAIFGDKSDECEDLSGNATGGARAGTSNEALCLSKIDCILGTGCASTNVTACYCGTQTVAACATSASPGNGACAQAEVDGSNHLITDPASAVLPSLASRITPAGQADSIFACSVANGCSPLCNQGGTCIPATACPAGQTCGTVPDGCGGNIACGVCGSGQTCTGGGQCCTRVTACPAGQNCQSVPDGCGGTLSCGSCTAGQTCTAAGQCCTPATACPAGQTCGTASDGCGGTISCGACAAGARCVSSGQCCAPVTSCPAGQTCGTAPDGCGGTIECGTCGPNQICDGTGHCAACAGECTCGMFNNGGPCTPTELKFVNKSLDCYTCLINGACLDDVTFGDFNNECEDLSGNATGGSEQGLSSESLCLSAIDCVLATSCASSDVAACYCGSLVGSLCATSMSPGDGVCAASQAAGVNHFATDPASVVSPNFGNKNAAAGKADSIFACSIGNGCAPLCNQ